MDVTARAMEVNGQETHPVDAGLKSGNVADVRARAATPSSKAYDYMRTADEVCGSVKRTPLNARTFWAVKLKAACREAESANEEANLARNTDGYDPKSYPDSAYVLRETNCMQRACDWRTLSGHCRLRIASIDDELGYEQRSALERPVRNPTFLVSDPPEEMAEESSPELECIARQKRKLSDLETNNETLVQENRALKSALVALLMAA